MKYINFCNINFDNKEIEQLYKNYLEAKQALIAALSREQLSVNIKELPTTETDSING